MRCPQPATLPEINRVCELFGCYVPGKITSHWYIHRHPKRGSELLFGTCLFTIHESAPIEHWIERLYNHRGD